MNYGIGSTSSVGRARLVMLLIARSLAQSPAGSAGKSIPTQLPDRNAILAGTDWYPEQWPELRWEEDLRLMEATHLKVVRLAEFSWSTMEPSEGHYDFDWLEQAVNLAAKHGIVSVLGTPAGGPPAGLTRKDPDTLRVEQDGRRASYGMWAHGSLILPRYREFCRQNADEMARRFGHNANVVGWQMDNEYGYGWMSYDEPTLQRFQEWLKAKYKSRDNPNQHWTTSYWSQTYDDWSEIPMPRQDRAFPNPALRPEWQRFTTDTWTSYQQNQIDAIRQHADPRQFVTGNFVGFGDGFDHYLVAPALTFAAWDDDIGSGQLDPDGNGLTHDLSRGFKRQNLWVIETQPGAVNWADVNNFLNRGEMRLMAWQAVGHGADDVSWQWRSALGGRKVGKGSLSYIGAILDDKLMAAAGKWMAQKSGVSPEFGPVLEAVEVCPRTGGGSRSSSS